MDKPTQRQPTTPEDLRALTHPLSWRILRLCLDEAWTNQQLAERLGVAPATLLRRVRALNDAGFLISEPPRQGAQGAWERPYRATGHTWRLEINPQGDRYLSAGVERAIIEAHVAEIQETDPLAQQHTRRAVLRLDERARAELDARADALLDEFAARATPDGHPVAILWSTVDRQEDQNI
ncbi:helix-turn-helix domain-containing protein [Arthrobacter sp. KNU-44]|uniref:helix-turn-helix domain-containing protein n=1 Tax=Arthrobacter sp. KNU-44 TaxID=3450744 RepID=UPI003F43DF17